MVRDIQYLQKFAAASPACLTPPLSLPPPIPFFFPFHVLFSLLHQRVPRPSRILLIHFPRKRATRNSVNLSLETPRRPQELLREAGPRHNQEYRESAILIARIAAFISQEYVKRGSYGLRRLNHSRTPQRRISSCKWPIN